MCSSISRATFVGEGGLEYLFGYVVTEADKKLEYRGRWPFSRVDEKNAFEGLLDFVIQLANAFCRYLEMAEEIAAPATHGA